MTKDHQPVEFFLSPGEFGDVNALTQYDFDLPEGSQVFADKAYNHYVVEDILDEVEIQLALIARRIPNARCPLGYVSFSSITVTRSKPQVA